MASILLECRLALVVDASHAFDEHLPEIIQGLRHLGFDQRCCQRRALGGASRCMRAASRLRASVANWCTLTAGTVANAGAPTFKGVSQWSWVTRSRNCVRVGRPGSALSWFHGACRVEVSTWKSWSTIGVSAAPNAVATC